MFGSDLGATGTGFGVGSAQEVEDLNKALTAGYGRGGDMTDGAVGSPLRVESLEGTLKITTFSERNIVFWKDIPKLPAFNTVEEFNQLNSYGNSGGYFVPEGVSPQESDATYARRTVQVKYVGTMKKVTHQMTLVRPAHGDVIALETMNGTREVLRTVEEALFNGNSACVEQEWDGFEKQFHDGIGTEVNDQNIFDMRGEALTEANLGEAARVIIDNYGFPTAMYMGYETMQDLNNLFLPKERISLNAANPGQAGFALQQFMTAGGAYNFRPSVFLRPGGPLPVASIGASASIPSVSGVTLQAIDAADATSKLAAGTYAYAVVLENRFGKTAGITTVTPTFSTSATSTAGERVNILVSGLTANTASAILIYRSVGTAGTGALKLLKRLPMPAGATFAYQDKGEDFPGTSKAYLMQVDLDVMSFKQLAPFTKIPLATIDPSIRWMQLLYGTPALYAPRKMVLVKNIGKYVPTP